MLGRDRKPTALITALARHTRVPSGWRAVTSHTFSASSQITDVTSVWNSMSRRTSKWSATQLKYFSFSLCGQNGLG